MANVTMTPVFFTATLPPTPVPQVTQISTLPVPSPVATEETDASPIEGMTTTQINVRAAPSTVSVSLGMIGIFVKVQITGRDASGSWYQIVYAESQTGEGWIRAEYVQVNDAAAIPLVGLESGSGSKVSGMVIQKVNVRSGPGVGFELLGVLNANDLVFITGQDSGGEWIQIEFASAPDGKGWVTAEFLQADELENVHRIGATIEETPTVIIETPTPAMFARTAAQDGDSMQSPMTKTVFSVTGSRALQVQGDVSALDGDTEDWIQFISREGDVLIQVLCPNDSLRVELWNHKKPVGVYPCGETSLANVVPGSDYFLRLVQNGTGYTSYALHLEVVP